MAKRKRTTKKRRYGAKRGRKATTRARKKGTARGQARVCVARHKVKGKMKCKTYKTVPKSLANQWRKLKASRKKIPKSLRKRVMAA